jgi:hypothetical protein
MWRVCGPSAGWGVACHWVLRLVRALGTSNARACCGLSWYAADAGSAGCCEHHVCGVYTYDLRLTTYGNNPPPGPSAWISLGWGGYQRLTKPGK